MKNRVSERYCSLLSHEIIQSGANNGEKSPRYKGKCGETPYVNYLCSKYCRCICNENNSKGGKNLKRPQNCIIG